LEAKNLIDEISSAVRDFDRNRLADAARSAIKEHGIGTEEIRKALFRGIDSRRRELLSPAGSLPEYLLSMEAMAGGLELIRELTGEKETEKTHKVVLGVINGDVHDLGKNIVVSVYRACGWEVLDLGSGVTPAQFADTAVEIQADLVGISCMMSTPLPEAESAISEVKRLFPQSTVMIGGAAISREMAQSIGADGWAESAVTLIEETTRALGKHP